MTTTPDSDRLAADELRGLSAAEAAQRAREGRGNRVRRAAWAEYGDIVVRNLFTLFNALVVPAAVALATLREYRGAVAVSGMAVVNTLLGLAQEVRAKWHLDHLALLAEARARVVRDGRVVSLPAGDVVQDDIVLLTTGDAVVADGPVVSARFLEVDEALLTGESDPVPRKAGEPLLSGSFCVAGEGVYRAERVGADAFAQRTSILARRYRYTASPLQQIIDLLIRLLTLIAVLLCGLYVGMYLVEGFPETNLWQMIAATVTSMVPQGLVLMTTLAFTLGAVRMSRRGALVQRLSAVETMAGIDVLCMDKTGTLTTSRLRLDQVRPLAESEEEVRRRLRWFAWATIDGKNKSIQALRDGLGPAGEPDPPQLLDQLPFKSQNRYSAVRLRAGGGEYVLVLGACEALRPFLDGAGDWEAAWKELLPTGLRLLLFAAADADGTPFQGSLEGRRLRPLALVALSDELRPEAEAVLEALAAQGIGFKILSGDNAETVRATVAHLRLPLAKEPVVTGEQLANAPDPAGLVRERSVFGRVSPQQKLDIVAALQQQGHRVAMLGDGVNDLLPIKRADLGIAMGDGSSATKTVAGLVLENNNFELLPATLEEGRNILRNLHRAAKLFLLKNVYTLLLIVAALGVFGLEFPYLPQQVTLLNALTIGVPVFLITLTRTTGSAVATRDFLRQVGWFAVTAGTAMGAGGLVMYLIAGWGWDDPVKTQRTLLLSVLILMGLANLRQVTANGVTSSPGVTRLLQWWPMAALAAFAVAVYWPVAADFFQLTPMSVAEWGVVLAVAAAAFGIGFVFTRQVCN